MVAVVVVIIVVVVLTLVGIKRVKSRAVAAAKLVFSWGNEGEMSIVGAATQGRQMVVDFVVEDEVAYGFACIMFTLLEHKMEINHYFAL